jgi:hypothetical protein
MLPPCVLWIDPGLVSGLAWLINGHQFHAGEYGFMETGTLIEQTCAQYEGTAWIGWERFTIFPHTPSIDAHHAIEMIGVTRRLATRYRCRILTPANQHTPKPPEQRRLKAIGWWRPGEKDAQSAAGHMLAWLQKTNQVPPRERELLDQLTGRVS